MKKISKIITLILVFSMFTTCIYATDVPANDGAQDSQTTVTENVTTTPENTDPEITDPGVTDPAPEPEAIVLKAPKIRLVSYNRGAVVEWDAVANATSYKVWRKVKGGSWKEIKTTTSKSYKNTKLKKGKKYYYKVKAVHAQDGNVVTSDFSSTKAITIKSYLTGTIKKGYGTGVIWKPSRKYKEGSSSNKIGTSLIGAGTKVKILDRQKVGGKTMAHIKLSNGKKYWIRNYNLNSNAPYTTKDYSAYTKEKFVNDKRYSSKTKYLLFISIYTQKVYVFKGKKGNWELQDTYKCCTGKADTRTPQGTFSVKKKAAKGWCYKYVTYFQDKNSFHTRPYGTVTMGRPASNGCIRLYDDDAKYIYKKIPMKTTVVAY